MNVQVIEKEGEPEWAVIPYADYQRLKEAAQILEDIRAYDETKKALEDGAELVPSEVAYAILDGENPIRVWRKRRGLTQRELAEAVGISPPYLSQLESGKRKGATEVLSAIAEALNLTLDDVVDISLRSGV
jgi:DNA-binding XRE family transcriptional regulator